MAPVNDGVYVSASSLRLLQDCPRAFSYKYIFGYRPEDVAPALVLGRACHTALADWYERLKHDQPEPTLAEMVAVASISIDEARNGPTPIARADVETDLVAEATRMLGAFVVSNPYRPKKVLAIEMPFTIRVGRHPVTGEHFDFEEAISGIFDMIVEDELGVMVVDHKVGKRRPAIDGGVDLQLAIYATAAEAIYPHAAPVRLAHHVLVRNKTPVVTLTEIPRSPNDTAEALEAVASGVELIHLAVGHPRPGRLLGRHRSWRCGGCGYRRRCAGDRT
jgi:hypothetical protein